jgi:hypothetical protein
MPDPVLSVVVTSRNDDHGEQPLRRTQLFLNGLIAQCQRHQLRAELIIVEWNPPADRPALAEVLRLPADLTWCPVRFLTVPAEVHAQLPHSAELPLFQMIAKNVGIRRARGQFVLATNIDILFSDELVRYIAEGHLQPGRLYRVDRHDIRADVPERAEIDEQLRWCRANLLRLWARTGTFPLTPDGRRGISPGDIFTPDQGLELGTGWYAPETESGERFCWVGPMAELRLAPRMAGQHTLTLELEPGPSVGGQAFTLQVWSDIGLLARATVRHRQRLALALPADVTQIALQVVEGGWQAPDSPRTLCYRVFAARWETGPAWQPVPALGTADANAAYVPAWNVTAADVAAPHAGIRFGAGWENLAHNDGGRLRWAGLLAHLQLTAPASGPANVLLEVEPGPGVGRPEFTLAVSRPTGELLATGTVNGGQAVQIALPVVPGQPVEVVCHAPAGGLPLPHTARVLDFCVRSATWMPGPAWQPDPTANFTAFDRDPLEADDILGPGLRTAGGWGAVEELNGERIRWIERTGTFLATPPSGLAWPVVCFETQPGPSVNGPTALLEVVGMDGTIVACAELQDRQRVYVRLPVPAGQTGRFRLRIANGGQTPAHLDRPLDLCIFRAHWTSQQHLTFNHSRVEDLGRCELADVTQGGVRFGRGYDPIELFQDERMRWAGVNACLVATAPPRPGTHALYFDLEPGYGTNNEPVDLHWETDAGQPIGHLRLAERGRWRLDVPTTPGGEVRLIARVANGGVPVPGTTRVLNFRIFAVNWGPGVPWKRGLPNVTPVEPLTAEFAADDVPGGSFGAGWYPVETWQGERLRWSISGAVLSVTPPEGAEAELALDLEVGPGVGSATTVTVRDELGQLVTEAALTGRDWLRVPVQAPAFGPLRRFTLHYSNAGRLVPHDPRVLDVRLFAIEWNRPVPTEVPPEPAPVPVVVEAVTPTHARRPHLLRQGVLSRVLQLVRGGAATAPHDQGSAPTDLYARAVREQPPTLPSAPQVPVPVELHTNASGDFMLIDRDTWWKLRGYPEFAVFSMHLDTLFCFIAHHGGAVETVLPDPLRIYHIEHGTGSGWTPEGAAQLTQRIRAKGIPFLECSEVFNWGAQMRAKQGPVQFNDATWGYAGLTFAERVFHGRQRRGTK